MVVALVVLLLLLLFSGAVRQRGIRAVGSPGSLVLICVDAVVVVDDDDDGHGDGDGDGNGDRPGGDPGFGQCL